MDNQLTYREKSVKKFLKGEARKPYTLRIDIAQGLKERKNQNSNEHGFSFR